MVFTLKPIVPEGDFHWDGRGFHLTLSELVPLQIMLQTVRRATSTPLLGYSHCQEDTSEYNDEGHQVTDGHEHTHFAMLFTQRINLKGARKFDVFLPDGAGGFEQLHPHVQPKVTMKQMEQLFTQYHAGRKYDLASGKTIFKAPIEHTYHLPPLFEFHRAQLEEVRDAPSTFEACVVGEVRVRSVSDVLVLRNEAQKNKRYKHKYDRASFWVRPPPNWHILHMHGGTGLGKTKFALSLFDNPCHVKPFDSIGCVEALMKMYDPDFHDGLVLDEANLSFLTRQQVIAFYDEDDDCTLDVRFKSFTLPPCKKIIVSNEAPDTLYPPDPAGAIARRFKKLHITRPTYMPNFNAAATPATQPLMATPATARPGAAGPSS